jgi:N-acetylneuraminate synthase
MKERLSVRMGNIVVGDGNPTLVVAEIGINHNGSLEIAKELINVSEKCGCDAVKFQKRTVEVVYSAEELTRPRESPFGDTNGDLKRGLEFGQDQYHEIDRYCNEKGIMWYASPWDKDSVDFLEQFDPPCYKIASACLTDDELLHYVRSKGRPVILSTGMSTKEQIRHAVKDVIGEEDLILLHCTSTYPAKLHELNLNCIPWLRSEYSCPVGYSGHETGIVESAMAVMLGAVMVERHVTLDRAMWGSDQAASLEPEGLRRMVRDIRNVPVCLGDGEKCILESEQPILQKLRKVK